MEHLWLVITVVTALLQAVRTAAQKDLNRHLSTMATTFVRSLFGLPVVASLLGVVLLHEQLGLPRRADGFFLGMCAIGAIGQILATALLVRLFSMRNFAVASMLTKSELIFIAILGALFFSEQLSLPGWIGILLTLAGILLISLGRLQPGAIRSAAGWRETLLSPSMGIGLLSGALFAICALAMREAILHLDQGSAFYKGGWTVVMVVAMQVAMQCLWFAASEPHVLERMLPHWRTCTLIGLTSGSGSYGWMVAFALQNASYVRAVGQVEAVFTLLLSWLWFRERIGPWELAGIATIVVGVLVFRLYA